MTIATARPRSPGSMAAGILSFDIGGANLKAADGLGRTHAETFELWRRQGELASRLTAIAREWRPRRVVATMTGEIADCYADRRTGVADIVAAVSAAAGAVGATVGIYLVDGSIVPPETALLTPLAAAASNWHALARLAALFCDETPALLLDVGSTTTDIILVDRRGAVPLARDDAGRMASGELVYTGVERTALGALVRSLPLRGRRRPLAAETFARSQDVWLLLGRLPEDPASCDTADGGPATRAAARVRLARMALLEPAELDDGEAVAAARRCADVQTRLVANAIRRVLAAHGRSPLRAVISGHGRALAEAALRRALDELPIVLLEEVLGPTISRAAPAHAVALVAGGAIP